MTVKAYLNSTVCVVILCFYKHDKCAGKLTLSSAEVREGETLVLTCHSTEPLGLYTFYSERNGIFDLYGHATGSFRTCQNGTQIGYVLRCDFDSWTFNLTILQPVHNQVIICNRTTGRDQITSISATIYMRVPVKRVSLSTPSTIDVVSGNSYTFTCKTFGSRPAAEISWHFHTSTLAGNNSVISENESRFDVTSNFTFIFTKEDQGKVVYCSSNIVGEITLESTKTFLNVLYISEVQMMPEDGLNIVAGQKLIVIICFIESANPEVNITYRWMKNNGYNTYLISTNQLYLIKHARVEDSGRYSCTVSNAAGSSSGFIDVNVQNKPFQPLIIQIFCMSRYAYISSRSSDLGIEGKQILQYSVVDDLYENATVEVLDKIQPEVDIFKVLNLSPGTEYTFRILASNFYGMTSSKRQKCSTDFDAQAERKESCEMEPIIGVTLGSILFIVILLLCATFLFNLRSRMVNKGKNDLATSRTNDASYVDQALPSQDHHYQGFSTKEMMTTNTYEKIEGGEYSDIN